GLDGNQGPCNSRRGGRLQPGASTLPTGGRHSTALRRARGVVAVLSGPGTASDGARAGGAAPRPGPERRGPGAARAGASSYRRGVSEPRRAPSGPGASGPGQRPLRFPATSVPHLHGAWGILPHLRVLGAVAAGLSGASLAAERGGADPGPRAVLSAHAGGRAVLRGDAPQVPRRA